MKICMITPFRPERDGVGDCSVALIPEIEKIRKDLKFVIISREIGQKEKDKNIHRILYKKSVTRNILIQLVEELKSLPRTFVDVIQTIKIIRKENVDIVHVQHEPGVFNLFYAPLLFFLLKFSKRKKILTLHGRDYSILKFFHRTFLYPFPDLITVHTDVHKKIVNRPNVVVIPMGINKLPKTEWKFFNRILFFGFVSPHKGLEFLIRSFRKVLNEIPDAELLLHLPVNPVHKVEVEYRKKILEMIGKEDVQKNTRVVSEYTEREKLSFVKSNIVVFPYTKSYSAGQSAALLDSLSAGKAVIVTRIPGIYERIVNNKNGFVVEPENEFQLADAMIKLLKHKELLRNISRNNLKMAERESWKRVAGITLGVYDRLVRK